MEQEKEKQEKQEREKQEKQEREKQEKQEKQEKMVVFFVCYLTIQNLLNQNSLSQQNASQVDSSALQKSLLIPLSLRDDLVRLAKILKENGRNPKLLKEVLEDIAFYDNVVAKKV